MENSIEEKIVKISIKQISIIIFCVISSTIAVMSAIYAYKNENSSGISNLESKLNSIESKVEIIAITQHNSDKLQSNSRQRDSAIFNNKIDNLNKSIDEIKSSISSNRYQHSFATSEN
jgi:outer membrane murein-binding lipoprotein Lpp